MDSALPRIARIRPNPAFVRPATLAGAIARLQARARVMECAHDLRAGYCLALSQQLTGVATHLHSGGAGEAVDWLERLQVEQVSAYLRALDGWDHGDFALTPAAWRAVFSMERRGYLGAADALRLESAVHAAYDLPLSIARIGTLGLSRTARYAAFVKGCAWSGRVGAGILARMRNHGAARRADVAWRDGLALRDADDDERRAIFARIERTALLMCREVRDAADPAPAAASCSDTPNAFIPALVPAN